MRPDPASIIRFLTRGFAISLGIAVNCALAAPTVQCTADLNGIQRELAFPLANDPYTVQAIDLEGRFRFKAVMMGTATEIDYVKIYVYYASGSESGLISEAVFRHPEASKTGLTPFTGTQYLYSPYLGHELKYECVLKGDAQ